jgi:hypothetical protein
MKRQSLFLLEERLSDMPERDENTLWFRPDKAKVDATISMFEWKEEDILTIVRRVDGMIPVEMSFRHTTRRVTTPIPQAVRAAKDWVNLVWSVPRNVLQIRVSIGSDEVLQVRILELEHSTEQYDDIPLAYVWARIGEFRRRQYKAQRAIDVIQQLAFDQGQEQRGSLRWLTERLNLEDPVPAEASLTMFEPKGSEESWKIMISTRSGTWEVEENVAKYWLDRMQKETLYFENLKWRDWEMPGRDCGRT